MSSIKKEENGITRTFESGAVRSEGGKVRVDLVPFDVLSKIARDKGDDFIADLFMEYHNMQDNLLNGTLLAKHPLIILNMFREQVGLTNMYTFTLSLAEHFTEGAEKYGERNWEKGIPYSSYIESGARHLLMFLEGREDEKHDNAFMWNMLCLTATLLRDNRK